ncbi:uncharacterized protein LOC144560140 isoform X1 [Carex rostrata]
MQEQNNIMFRQLYAMVGMQRPDLQAQGYSQGPQNVGLIGNITNLQGQGPTTLPQPHEGASGMSMAISQGLGADFTESNGGRNFQALLNVQSENEVATCLGADDEWFGEERQNNQPF